jgi:hypothetical protein
MPFLTSHRQIVRMSSMMISSNSELGWGWKSVTKAAKKVGGAAKKVGSGAVSVSKSAVGRVANVAASTLCNPDGTPKGSDATSRNYCRGVQLKRTASVAKYAPRAASTVQKVQAVRTAYYTPVAQPVPVSEPMPVPQFAPPAAPPPAVEATTAVDDTEALTGAFGFGPMTRAQAMLARRRSLARMRARRSQLRGLSADPDVNLLADFAGTNVNGIDGALTTSDVIAASPVLIAIAIGAYLFHRK